MKRIRAATKANPRKVLASVCALAVASAIVVGSGASFTSTTANPNTSATAGNLAHSNSKNGSAIFTETKMKPGETRSGTVDIANTGDIPGVFTLDKSNLVDTAGSGGADDFSAKLDLVVKDCGPVASANCASGATEFTGKLGEVSDVDLGTYAVGADHRYQFSVTFPNGTPAQDNPYKGAGTSVQFDWESVNN